MTILSLLKKILNTSGNVFNRLSLQQKLVALYILIIIIPIIIFTVFYSRDITTRAINDIRSKNENALEIEKIHIKNNIETMRRTAQMVVSDMEFLDFVKTRNEANINELIDFRMNALSNVTRLQNNNPAIENIRVYTTNPYIIEMWPILFHENRIMDKPWREETIERNGMELWWFDQQTEDVLERLPSQNTSKISLFRELDYPKDEHLGIIEINMFLKNFFPKMFGTEKNPDSIFVVFDRDMQMIRNNKHTFFEDEEIDIEKLKKEFRVQAHENMGSFQYVNKDTPYLLIHSYIDDLDSYLVNIISLEGLYAEIAKTRVIIQSGIVVLVVILSVFTYALISLLLKKMYRLKDSMKRVERGELDFDADISGNDEISELAVHFKKMLMKINNLIAEAVNKQAATKEAELKALKTQIDSHFLYNTLENIKMMAEIEGKYDISDAVTSLGEMMRYNLRWKNDFVALEEELNHIKNYIDIMNLRMDGLLTLTMDISKEMFELEVLKMSLQPVIENAVQHGIRPIISSRMGIIEVKVWNEDNFAIIEIKDNGIGMSSDKCNLLNQQIKQKLEDENRLVTTGSGIGLKNVNERIVLYYGEDYGLNVSSVTGEFTVVTIKIPYKLIKGGSRNV